MKKTVLHSYISKILILLFWIFVWWIAAFFMNSALLLPSPQVVFITIGNLVTNSSTWQAIALSMYRIGSGFLLAFFLAFILAFLAFCYPLLNDFLDVPIQIAKTLPVACFIVLLLIWQGAAGISFWIAFLMTFPPIYQGTRTGLLQMDRQLWEVSRVFAFSRWNQFWFFYRPALRESLLANGKLAISMAIKAGIAAELIGVPQNTIGEQLYMSKIYLDTHILFAWSIFILAIGKCSELFFYELLKRLMTGKVPMFTRPQILNPSFPLQVSNLCKSFTDKKVLKNISFSIDKSEILGISAPSGAGKTTLLRILAGLETADKGSCSPASYSYVFQENRLFEELTAMENVLLVCQDKTYARECLAALISEADFDKPCAEFSGGMKRCVAIVRAITFPSDILLLDEPFTALDEHTKEKAANLIRSSNKSILMTTHIAEEFALVGAKILPLAL